MSLQSSPAFLPERPPGTVNPDRQATIRLLVRGPNERERLLSKASAAS